MCFNFGISVAALTIGLLSGAVALYLRQYILGCLILAYSLMQLSEAVIWRGIDDENDAVNRVGTKMAKLLLPIHNIAIGVGVYLNSGRTDTTAILVGLLFYIFVLLGYELQDEPDSARVTTTCADTCAPWQAKLQWPFWHTWYALSYAVSIALMLYYVSPTMPTALIMVLFYSLTWLTTFWLGKTEAQGSFWCWSTAILAPVVVFLNGYTTTAGALT